MHMLLEKVECSGHKTSLHWPMAKADNDRRQTGVSTLPVLNFLCHTEYFLASGDGRTAFKIRLFLKKIKIPCVKIISMLPSP